MASSRRKLSRGPNGLRQGLPGLFIFICKQASQSEGVQGISQNGFSFDRIILRDAAAEWEQLFENRNRARRLARLLIRQCENFRQQSDSLQRIGAPIS